MVMNVTALGRSGLHDWLLQRVSAVILAAYSITLGYFFVTADVNHETWQTFILSHPMRFFTVLALISILLHAWVGLWIVFTDYVKPYALRVFLQMSVVLLCLYYLFWGILILWGIK